MTPSWRRYLRFWGARVGDDVDDELAFHVEMRVRDYIARGMSERDARTKARDRFGNHVRVRDNCVTIGNRRQRRMNRAHTIDALVQDLRYGLRVLARQKGWTTVALLTMSLGIGASTAVFSAVNSLVLNPLPYRDGNRVVMVWRIEPKSGVMITPYDRVLTAWKAQSHSFEELQQFGSSQMTFTGRGDAAEVSVGSVDPDFPKFAGVNLLIGRPFLPDETLPGGARVALLGETLWRERYAASADVIGRQIALDEKSYTIVGVAPARLRLPLMNRNQIDVWIPEVHDSLHLGGMVMARLRKGSSMDAATKELAGIDAHNQLEADQGSQHFDIKLVRPGDLIGFKTSLFLLAGAVALLLLVACANVAHLLLARGATRERELAIRAALGAGRWRLGRQLLTESTILAIVGCLAGVALGWAGVQTLAALRPASLDALARTRVDGTALWVAVGASVFAAIMFGSTAALHAVRRTTADALRATALAGTAAARTHRLRSMLVVSEMALSALLLVGAALLGRSVINLQHVDLGFDSRNLYAMSVNLSHERFPSSAERIAFIDRVVEAARGVPGVVSVTPSTATPPNIGGFMISAIEVEGDAAAAAPTALPMNFVTPTYFQALGIHLEGATFGPSSATANDVIINRGFARKLFHGRPALGARLRFKSSKQKPDDGWMRVVGIADDVPSRGLAGDRAAPFMYQPIDPAHSPQQWTVAVRTSGGANPVAALRGVVTSLDKRLVPPPVVSVDADLASTISTQRFTMVLLGVFATMAVVLSAIGLYGVISYVVTQRTREIGIRVALGATPANVARAIVARGLLLSVIGLAVGLTGAVWGTRLIKTVLFGVTGTDVPSYALAGVSLLAVSLIACAVPMRRAMRVDPVIAMRGE